MLSMVLAKKTHKKNLPATCHIYIFMYINKERSPSPQSSCELESAFMIRAVCRTGERQRDGVRLGSTEKSGVTLVLMQSCVSKPINDHITLLLNLNTGMHYLIGDFP